MVERFTADWLALREAVDHRSRPEGLLVPLRAWWRARGASHVVDLGSGTGSNLRYLAPRLDPGQRWRLVDHDRELLRRAGAGQVAGAEAVELIMWLSMRGALSNDLTRIHRNYYAPMTTGMGLIVFEENA